MFAPRKGREKSYLILEKERGLVPVSGRRLSHQQVLDLLLEERLQFLGRQRRLAAGRAADQRVALRRQDSESGNLQECTKIILRKRDEETRRRENTVPARSVDSEARPTDRCRSLRSPNNFPMVRYCLRPSLKSSQNVCVKPTNANKTVQTLKHSLCGISTIDTHGNCFVLLIYENLIQIIVYRRRVEKFGSLKKIYTLYDLQHVVAR